MHVDWYAELLGGLGDALLRVYSHEHVYASLAKLPPDKKAAVVLMCHNPALAELFKWHPMNLSGQLSVFDLGFNTPFHPWEDASWRRAHGLPAQSPCPMGGAVQHLEVYPDLTDKAMVNYIKAEGPYLILHPSAGQSDRDVPQNQCESMTELAKKRGLKVYVIGHSKYIRHTPIQGAEDLTNRLSVPGMIVAIRNAAGVITSHSSVTHVAWRESRPVFMLYPDWVKNTYVSRGAVGYMEGINRPDCDHMLFPEYREDRFSKWMESCK
jgi:hypothetical protein